MKISSSLSTNSELRGWLSDLYNVREAYNQAQQRHDPYLSPHGFFSKLRPGNTRHAVEFLEEFGPLKMPYIQRYGDEDFEIQVNLAEFWGLHLRFRLVAQLWESCTDKKQLIEAWREVHRWDEEASKWDNLPLSSIVWDAFGARERHSRMGFPWEQDNKQPEEWLRSATLAQMRQRALILVQADLNVHVSRSSLYWERDWEPSGAKFRLGICADSLWSTIWEFFGLDTAGRFWRRCPHCQKLFYPKRRDQFYCTPREQALASKRAYIRRRRAQERRERNRRKRRKTKSRDS